MRKFLASARLCDDVPRKLLRSNLNLFLTGSHRLRLHQQQFSTSTQDLLQNATKNVSNILANSMKLQQSEKLMVLYDNQCELSSLLCQAYKDAAYPCGDQIFADFDAVTPDFILDHIDHNLKEGDLAVLIQTGAFNLREYRFRLELFKRGIKVFCPPPPWNLFQFYKKKKNVLMLQHGTNRMLSMCTWAFYLLSNTALTLMPWDLTLKMRRILRRQSRTRWTQQNGPW